MTRQCTKIDIYQVCETGYKKYDHRPSLPFFWGGEGDFLFLNAFELEHFLLRCPVLSKTLFSAAGVVSLLHFARPSLPCFEVSCVQSSPLHFISGCISTHCIWFERITPHIPCAVHPLWGSAVTLLQLSCPSLILRPTFLRRTKFTTLFLLLLTLHIYLGGFSDPASLASPPF